MVNSGSKMVVSSGENVMMSGQWERGTKGTSMMLLQFSIMRGRFWRRFCSATNDNQNSDNPNTMAMVEERKEEWRSHSTLLRKHSPVDTS